MKPPRLTRQMILHAAGRNQKNSLSAIFSAFSAFLAVHSWLWFFFESRPFFARVYGLGGLVFHFFRVLS
jgi:hypothetical protein